MFGLERSREKKESREQKIRDAEAMACALPIDPSDETLSEASIHQLVNW